MNAIVIPADVYAEQIPDCKPGETVTITGVVGAVDAEGNYPIEDPTVTKAKPAEPVEEVEPAVEDESTTEGMSPAAAAVMKGK